MTQRDFDQWLATELAIDAEERALLALPSDLALCWSAALSAVGASVTLLCALVVSGCT